MKKLILSGLLILNILKAEAQWSLTGNSGTNPAINYIGTSDDQDLIFKRNNARAGWLNTSLSNTAFGVYSLYSNTTGYNNTAMGYTALYSNTTGYFNTAIGNQALASNTTGYYNMAIGESALLLNISGSLNTAIGRGTLYNNTTGSLNTANGSESLYSNTTGSLNGAFGAYALFSNTTGSNNIAQGMGSLYSNTTGGNNTAVGIDALRSSISGYNNTAIGKASLYANTTGSDNTTIGAQADVASGDLTNATAIGANAKVTVSNAIQLGDNQVTQVFAGTGANAKLIAGGLQVTGGTPGTGKVLTSDAAGNAIWQTPGGGGSGWSLTGNAGTVDGTHFIGTTDNVPFNIRVNNQKAGRIEADNMKANTFYGYQSGNANTTGTWNTAQGYQALYSNTTGRNNTAMGRNALLRNDAGSSNSAYGIAALALNTSGSVNTAIGNAPLYNNTTGSLNTAVGDGPLYSNTTGGLNTAVGGGALWSNITGNNNTALGFGADVSSGGLTNATAIGYNAKVTASNAIQLGNSSVTQIFAGTGANAKLIAGGLQVTGGTPGTGKVLTSDDAGNATWQTPSSGSGWSLTGNAGTDPSVNFIGTSDDQDVIFKQNGIQAGWLNSNLHNTAFGVNALVNNTTGFNNIASGYIALYSNTTGNWNAANGSGALFSNTTGNWNTANGDITLYFNTTGSSNTATGMQALYSNTTGNSNTALGYWADVSTGNLTNATAIGANTTATASNQVRIGNSSVISIGGQVNWTTLSDGRFKKDIKEDVPGLEFIKQLKPVTYHLDITGVNNNLRREPLKDEKGNLIPISAEDQEAIKQKERITYTGFIAQEVQTAAKRLNYEFSGVDAPKNNKDMYGLRYAEFVVPLVKAAQELSEENESLKTEVKDLKKQLKDQQKQIDQILQQLDKGKNNTSDTHMVTVSAIPTTNNKKGEGSAEETGLVVYPNPANGTVKFRYYMDNAGMATLEMVDMGGRTIAKPIDSFHQPGWYNITCDISKLPTGVYTCVLNANKKMETKQLIVQ